MMTTSVAVQAPRARSKNSMAPGAVLELRSESMATAWPEGPTATNFCWPIHWTLAVWTDAAFAGARSDGLFSMNRHYVSERPRAAKASRSVGDEARLGKSTAERIHGKDAGCAQGCKEK